MLAFSSLPMEDTPMPDPFAALKSRVYLFKKTHWIGLTIDESYCVGVTKQRYCLLTTRGLWLKVRLFVENQLPFGTNEVVDIGIETDNSNAIQIQSAVYEVLKSKEEMTTARAERYKESVRNFFEQPSISKVWSVFRLCPIVFTTKAADCALLDPKLYFKRGTIILRENENIFCKGAIYIDDGKVIGFEDGSVYERDILEVLAGGEVTCSLYLLHFIVALRSEECIANEAIKAFRECQRNPRLSSLYSSWKSFISICSTGVYYALDTT